MKALFDVYMSLDRRLVATGMPPTSPWWCATLARFLGSNALQLVARVGRRGGKSSSLCRLAVLLALQDWPIPPGDIGHVLFISTRKDEASARLHTIETILRALGVPFHRSGDAIELEGRPIRFLVLPATVAGVSGPTAIAVIADECAKWKDADTGANPAKEVLAALRPTLATMARHGARIILSSSPVGLDDAHAEAFERGDGDGQMVANAPTWIANPTLTEDETKRLERDERTWKREYAAIPAGVSGAAFDPDAIDAAFAPRGAYRRIAAPIVAIDPAGAGKDDWAVCVVGYVISPTTSTDRYLVDEVEDCPGAYVIRHDHTGAPILNPNWRPPEPYIRVDGVRRFDTSYRAQFGVKELTATVAQIAKSAGASTIVADQDAAFALAGWFHEHHAKYRAIATTASTKAPAVKRLRQAMNDGRIHISGDRATYREFANYRERVTNGGVSYAQGRDPNGGHYDVVAATLTAMIAESEGLLHGSVSRVSGRLEIVPHVGL